MAPPTYLLLALLAGSICAGCILARGARSMLGWRVSYLSAILGQIGIGAASLFATGVLSGAALLLGVLDGNPLFVFAGIAYFAVWKAGLAVQIRWLADRSRRPALLRFRLNRLETYVFLTAIGVTGAAGVALLGLTWFAAPTAAPTAAPSAADPQRAAAKADKSYGGMPVAAPARGLAPVDAPTADVLAAVRAWADAWAQRDAVRYLGFYAADFRPPNGASRAAWEADRRRRLAQAGRITVGIEAPEVVFRDAATATVKFRQRYQSDLVSETAPKTLVLIRTGGAWRIQEERSGRS